MKEHTIVLNGQIFSYLDNEKKEAPVLIFLHGWECNKYTMKPVYEAFLSEYRVISIDFPGFGASSLANDGFTLGDYTKQLLSFIQKLQLSQVHLIGHSFGGRVSIDFASKYPEILASISLINSGGIKNTSLKVRVLKVFAKIGNIMGLSRYKSWIYRHIIKEADVISAERSEALRISFRNVLEEDLQERAKDISLPALLLWGEKDMSTPLWHGKRWKELIAHSELYIHPGDHFFFLKDPEWTVERIREFLSSLPQKSL